MAVVQEAKRGKTWYEMVVMRRLTCGGLKPLALVYYVSCGVRDMVEQIDRIVGPRVSIAPNCNQVD